jgi:hypothetical protein
VPRWTALWIRIAKKTKELVDGIRKMETVAEWPLEDNVAEVAKFVALGHEEQKRPHRRTAERTLPMGGKALGTKLLDFGNSPI